MRSPNNPETNQFEDNLDRGDRYFQIAKTCANQKKLDQALAYCGLACKENTQNHSYSEFYREICLIRGKLYKPILDWAIAEFNYHLWTKKNTPKLADLRQFCLQLPAIKAKPTISIIIAENIPKIQQLKKIAQSIQDQVYPHWELFIPVTVNPPLDQNNQVDSIWQSQLENLIHSNLRLKIVSYNPEDQQLEFFKHAIAAATGSWIAVITSETLLTPIALYEFIKRLEQNQSLDIAYGDEDQINKQNCLEKPWFKPDWSPELFLARNYVNSLVFIRRDLALEIICEIAEDLTIKNNHDYIYDLLLRASERTKQIEHISQIFAHIQPKFQLQPINNSQLIAQTLQRRGEIAQVAPHPDNSSIQKIRYQLSQNPLISIIILTKNLAKLLDECLNSIFTLSTYQNYEIVLIDNSSDEAEALRVITKWQQTKPKKLRVYQQDEPFNYSQLNNFGVSQAQGNYLLFLNNDTKVITPDWLEAMVEQAQRKQVGAVGAMLLYPDHTIQHAGVILGVKGIAGHSHRHYQLGAEGYYQHLLTTNNVTAVTGACLMCQRDRFEQVGGFNEKLAVAYNDVDFCLKLHQQGYQNLWIPHVKLYHYESKTRTPENTPAKQRRIQQEVDYMQTHWRKLITQDPFYNRNLTKDKEDFSLNVLYQFQIKAIALKPINQEQLISYFLDQPQVDKKSNQYLEIVGWVIGKLTPAIAIEISYYDYCLITIPVCQPRPDVAKAYPQMPTAINSGFATTIDLSQIDIDKLMTNSLTSNLETKLDLHLTTVLANDNHLPIATIQLTC